MPVKKQFWTYKDPVGIEWSDEIEVFTEAVPAKGAMEEMRKYLKKLKKYKKKKGGFAIEITMDNVMDIANTIENYSKIMFEDMVGQTSGFFTDVMTDGIEGALASEWRKIATSIRDHMQLLAYKRPKERRNLVQHAPYWKKVKKWKSPSGGELEIRDLKSLVVSRWEGQNPVGLSGHLRSSIGYKMIWNPKRPKLRQFRKLREKAPAYAKARVALRKQRYREKRDIAIGVRVGPGAGDIPAPVYTMAQNYGRPPVLGQMYIPGIGGDGRGRMWGPWSKKKPPPGAIWSGFEGKFFVENTGLWLQREQKKLVSNTSMMARIYVRQAIKTYRSRYGQTDVQRWLERSLQNRAISIVEKNLKIITTEMIDNLIEALVKGKSEKS